MAELTITAAVGELPAPNRPADVRTVQMLLQNVRPPVMTTVAVTGVADAKTISGIREFQKRFMNHPDGKVDPDGRTLMHLNDGFASNYIRCDVRKRVIIDRDIIEAQKWLDIMNRRLNNASDADMRQKVLNIFHLDTTQPVHIGRLMRLRHNCLRLRQSLDEKLTFKCEDKVSAFAAWVERNDPTIHFAINYFNNAPHVRIAKIVHERSHTVLNTDHSGMAGGGEIRFGVAPDDPNTFTFEQSIRNAYCYEWLVIALQPTYDAAKAREF